MRKSGNIPTSELRRFVRYNPETGIFRWREKAGCKGKLGEPLGSVSSHGYLEAQINLYRVYLHRAAWQYIHGVIAVQIDHINGNKLDNRLSNLRPVTQQLNSANMKMHPHNKSGYKGVVKYRDRFRAYIHIDYKTRYLGTFPTAQSAHAAYCKAANAAWGEHYRAA